MVKPADPENSLPEYLAERYKDLTPAPTTGRWRDWLQRGDVLLLLDGLDEISGNQSFLTALKTALDTFKDCPTILTCRTVSFDQHQNLCPDFPVFTLAGLDENQRKNYIQAFPAEYPDRYNTDTLIEQLKRTPQMHSLAANPLLLSIICFVVDDKDGVTLPARRGELYAKVIEKLLDPKQRPRRVEVTYPGGKSDLPLTRKYCILEYAAFKLFEGIERQRQLTFGEDHLLSTLTNGAKAEELANPADVADTLLTDLTQNSGILRGDAEQGYFFLHLTVQEFLTAFYLNRQENRLELVKDHFWDFDWHETIILFAGLMGNPIPLLKALTKEKDDIFSTLLVLAGRCIAECEEKTDPDPVITRIMRKIFAVWWNYDAGYPMYDPDKNYLRPVVVSLARMHPQAFKILQTILHTFPTRNEEKRVRALKEIGNAWAVDELFELLKHENSYKEAMEALVEIGDPDIFQRFLKMLDDSQSNLKQRLMEIPGNLDAQVVEKFFKLALLYNEDVSFFQRVPTTNEPDIIAGFKTTKPQILRVLAKMGNQWAIEKLFKRSYDPKEKIRRQAVKAPGEIGDHRAVGRLLEMCYDLDPGVRQQAADALGEIGDLRAVDRLLDLCYDLAPEVRQQAADALRKLDEPMVVKKLTDRLHKSAHHLRQLTAEALIRIHDLLEEEELGELFDILYAADSGQHLNENEMSPERWESETPRIVDWLLTLLGHASSDFRKFAAMGFWLLTLLGHASSDFRKFAAMGLGVVGKSDDSQIIERLLAALHDNDTDVRWAALIALEEILDSLEDPRIVDKVLALLDDTKKTTSDRRIWAVHILRIIDDLKAFEGLLDALHDNNEEVRYYAVCALEELCDPDAIDGLLAVLKIEPGSRLWSLIKSRAADALEKISSRNREHSEKILQYLLEDP